MLANIKIAEWMTRSVISVEPTITINAAYTLMKDKRIRRLPIMKNEKIVGIITLGDLREAFPSDATTLSIWEMRGLLDKLTVEQVMTREVLTIRPDDTIIDAARLMLNRKISGLPVVDDQGKLVGMLTESDIFRMVIRTSTDQPLIDTYRIN